MVYVIVDFEATCCDKGSVPRKEMEIIEIGAVALDGRGPGILSEFQCFIRPGLHPQLTDFCRELTSIRQRDVDQAPVFTEALQSFREWLARLQDPLFCSWGDYDRRQLQQDCRLHQADYPFDERHINIKTVFSQNAGAKRGLPLGLALQKMGLPFDGTPHRGIDDARNMARLAPMIFVE